MKEHDPAIMRTYTKSLTVFSDVGSVVALGRCNATGNISVTAGTGPTTDARQAVNRNNPSNTQKSPSG